MREVIVTAYQEKWEEEFQKEAHELKRIFFPHLLSIHHIGSTSILGMSAKPIIDILIVLDPIETADNAVKEMESRGYEAYGENGIPSRRYFSKGGDKRTHHVHIYPKGDSNIERHIAFRDFLRSHPQKALQYSECKVKLARLYPYDIESYIAGKDRFVKNLEKEALVWKKGQ